MHKTIFWNYRCLRHKVTHIIFIALDSIQYVELHFAFQFIYVYYRIIQINKRLSNTKWTNLNWVFLWIRTTIYTLFLWERSKGNDTLLSREPKWSFSHCRNGLDIIYEFSSEWVLEFPNENSIFKHYPPLILGVK